ncbi:unnamed protein product [Phytophthora fragariaefolia]|uniref:Unnamed protein product n=1 Tax=Phytophthora fragariaefolia TaxID=1490495 RepID=A0A9W7CU89_9STRA|nr:unnamed protein product [Phytophthora fragariaefolia]
MSAQASGSVVGGSDMAFYVTRETIPERRIKAEVNQDDVEMARTVSTSSAQASRNRTSRTHRKYGDSDRSSASSDSDCGRRSRASAMSGTAKRTVSTLYKVHETLAKLESKTSTDKLAEQEAESKRKLDEAERRIHELNDGPRKQNDDSAKQEPRLLSPRKFMSKISRM